jgi:16S rRNA (cytosine967-C5)-methyltransferase
MADLPARIDRARLSAARALLDIIFRGAFVGSATDWHLSDPLLDARDCAFASAVVYGTLAYYHRIVYCLETAVRRPIESLDREVVVTLASAVWQLYWSDSVPRHAAVDEAVELVRYFTGERAVAFANGVLRRLAKGEPRLPKKKQALMFGLTPELFGILKKSYGQKIAEEIGAASLLFDQSTEIRFNRLKYAGQKNDGFTRSISEQICSEGVKVLPGRLLPDAGRLFLSGRRLISLQSFTDGLFAVQGESSQISVLAAAVKPGQNVLEIGAGAGGKTHALAARMGNSGAILAVDSSDERLAASEAEAARLGVSIVSRLFADGTKSLPGVDPDSFDLVFLDAPCSGLGLLAKKPEIRLRMSWERIESLIALQQALLRSASSYVRPGGTLLYATCTLNKAENEEQVETFLKSSYGSGFSCSSFADLLPDTVRAFEENGRLTLFPHRDGVDGFFLAKLIRSKV